MLFLIILFLQIIMNVGNYKYLKPPFHIFYIFLLINVLTIFLNIYFELKLNYVLCLEYYTIYIILLLISKDYLHYNLKFNIMNNLILFCYALIFNIDINISNIILLISIYLNLIRFIILINNF